MEYILVNIVWAIGVILIVIAFELYNKVQSERFLLYPKKLGYSLPMVIAILFWPISLSLAIPILIVGYLFSLIVGGK